MSQFKEVSIAVEDLFTTFTGLGKGQESGARSGDASAWTMSSIIASLDKSGWDDKLGPIPVYRDGDANPRIGNRRLTAMALLHQKSPNKWAGKKIKVRVYSKDTPDEVMDEIVASEIRSTEVHTRRDLVTLLATKARKMPGGMTQRAAAEFLGVEKLEKFNTFKEGALEVGADGVKRIKAGIPDTKVFRQKDIIMEGLAAAKAIREVADLFLSPTEKKYITADELYSYNQAFETDITGLEKTSPSQAAKLRSASSLSEVLEVLPTSLAAAQVGPIFAKGRETGAGSTPGGARKMSVAARKAVQATLGKCGAFNCIFDLFDGRPGATDEKALALLGTIAEAVNRTLDKPGQDAVTEFQNRVDSAAKALADEVKKASAVA